MPNDALKPCPFCGAKVQWATSTEPDDWEIQCPTEGCPLFFLGGDHTGRELEAAWNTRSADAVLPGLLRIADHATQLPGAECRRIAKELIELLTGEK